MTIFETFRNKGHQVAKLSSNHRFALTTLAIFLLVFATAMAGIRYTYSINRLFDEIESRNILAAKIALEHELFSRTSKLDQIINSVKVLEWYEFKRHGLSRKENLYLLNLKQYLRDIEATDSGLSNISLGPGICDNSANFLKEKNIIQICTNSLSAPIFISADLNKIRLESKIRQFAPNGELIGLSTNQTPAIPLDGFPKISIAFKSANKSTDLIRSLSTILPISMGVLFVCILLILFFIWYRLLKAQENVLTYIGEVINGAPIKSGTPNSFGFSDLEATMKAVVDKVIEFESNQKETELINLSSQISHDIRSPLTALRMLSNSLYELPEEKRILVRNSIDRINDIANGLLERSKDNNRLKKGNPEAVLISTLLDSIVSEKRIQYKSLTGVTFEHRSTESYGLFAIVIDTELKRVISNLINNSVESLIAQQGKIIVSVTSNQNRVFIHIEDNGIGIPEDLLKKIGGKGVSFGKSESKQSGSGLGVFHAKKTIESFNGRLVFKSEHNIGTIVTLELPKALAPQWFIAQLLLKQGQSLIVCDDDDSIFKVWSERIKRLDMNSSISIIAFSSGREFKTWVKENDSNNCIYLVDYELINEPQTGLDLIEELGIQKKSFLVTSRFNEAEIKMRCNKLDVKLIPKGMVTLLPILIETEK